MLVAMLTATMYQPKKIGRRFFPVFSVAWVSVKLSFEVRVRGGILRVRGGSVDTATLEGGSMRKRV